MEISFENIFYITLFGLLTFSYISKKVKSVLFFKIAIAFYILGISVGIFNFIYFAESTLRIAFVVGIVGMIASFNEYRK